jgi:membrane protease YdiL (CAAX protease family)
MKKKSIDYLGKGLIISLVLMVVDLIGGFAHLRFDTWFRWLSTLLLIILLIIFCIQYGKQQTDGVTFGKVFGYGFKISLVVAVLMVIYSLLSIYLIFPEYIDQVLAKTRTDLEAKGGISDEQIDQAVNMTKKFMQPVPIMLVTFLVMLFFGTIGSLLGAAFAKKSEPVPDVLQDNP